MDDHLGYEKSERSDNDDYRNGYKRKRVNSSYGAMEIKVPQQILHFPLHLYTLCQTRQQSCHLRINLFSF